MWRTTLVGVTLLCACLLVLATEYQCPDCTTEFSFAEFGAKEAWASKSGFDLYGGVNVMVSGPSKEAHVHVAYDQVPPYIAGNYLGAILPDPLELKITASIFLGGVLISQNTVWLTIDHITHELLQDGRTITYPIANKIGQVFDLINNINHMQYLMSSMMNLSGGSVLYWQNPYMGIPVYQVDGSQINYGVRFNCTTRNPPVPCY